MKTGLKFSSFAPAKTASALGAALCAWFLTLGGATLPAPAAAQSVKSLDTSVVEARDAARRKDRPRLAAARAAMQAGSHPLTAWVEYWDLSSRLADAQIDEVEAFYARWPGSYVEDRLRNDWLLELGRRRDWAALARDFPRFRMNDDREVTCWWLFTEHLAGRDVRDAARQAWWAQKENDDGCNLLATAMVDAKRFGPDEVWRKARLSVEAQRPGAAKVAVAMLGNLAAKDGAEAIDNPTKFLKRSGGPTRQAHELRLLAVMRLAASDLDAAVAALDGGNLAIPGPLMGWGWAYVGRQAAFKLSDQAGTYYLRATAAATSIRPDAPPIDWSDDTLAWGVRAVLRNTAPAQRWPQVLRLIGAMSPLEQREPSWVYWKARATAGTAANAASTDNAEAAAALRADAQRQLEAIAGAMNFYALLAAEDLGRPATMPLTPLPPSPVERNASQNHPGLARALMLADLGLRDEARREWNFSLRGMTDRELLASARLACERSDWLLCINTAERSRGEIDTALRYPMPFAAEITQAASAAGLDPALVFGLIRQETRFMPNLRSSVGASGLMQVMPATAAWMAKKIGMDWRNPAQIHDPLVNLTLGTRYLKLVLDDLGGSQAMAAAAYNAGPGRPRRWREGPMLEAAIWAENIPFNETRDYVKKVLSNAAVYSALIDQKKPPMLRPRLGGGIGPRDASAAPITELP